VARKKKIGFIIIYPHNKNNKSRSDLDSWQVAKRKVENGYQRETLTSRRRRVYWEGLEVNWRAYWESKQTSRRRTCAFEAWRKRGNQRTRVEIDDCREKLTKKLVQFRTKAWYMGVAATS